MEKFGIFELLDALSAIALDGEEKNEQAHPDGNDPVYAPPVYPTGEAEPKPSAEEPQKKPPVNTGEFAIRDFYKRHDTRAKK